MDTLLPILPEESLYSWLSRLFSYCYTEEVYDKEFVNLINKTTINPIYGKNLRNLFNYLGNPNFHNCNCELDLINIMTLVPFYLTFLNNSQKESIQNMILGIIPLKGNLSNLLGITNNKSLNGVHEVKFCPLCFEEDKKKYGIAYLHRNHSVQGNIVCHKHCCWLNVFEKKTNNSSLIQDINKLDMMKVKKIKRKDECLKNYYRLSILVNDFIEGKYELINIDNIIDKLNRKLHFYGLNSASISEIYEVWDYNFDIFVFEKDRIYNYYRQVILFILNSHKCVYKKVNPIFLLHLVCLLFKENDEFINY